VAAAQIAGITYADPRPFSAAAWAAQLSLSERDRNCTHALTKCPIRIHM
jgi:hypothetical protein